MKNIRKILAIGVTIILLFSGILGIVSGCEVREGFTPGFWKNHIEEWASTGLNPSMLVGDVLTLPPGYENLADDTLLQALKYRGGRGLEGAAKNMLRAAVAGLLNSAHPDINYPYKIADIQWVVYYPLSMSDRDLISEWMDWIDYRNNLGGEI